MKLACIVKEVSESQYGDYLNVTMVGQCVGENPDIWPAKPQQITIRNTPQAQRAYYVGRKLVLDAALK